MNERGGQERPYEHISREPNPLWHGVLAGCFGACASMFGKVAFDQNSNVSQYVISLLKPIMTLRTDCGDEGETAPCQQNPLLEMSAMALGRGPPLLAAAACNALMAAQFVRGMRRAGALPATAASAGANFLVSGACGWLFFEEKISLQWCIGALFIYTGIVLFSHTSAHRSPSAAPPCQNIEDDSKGLINNSSVVRQKVNPAGLRKLDDEDGGLLVKKKGRKKPVFFQDWRHSFLAYYFT